ncbi:uncharacterized protein MELLADRAFT_85611 [Melampsora larici-populina 98AG31]|uniref:Aspartyl/Glutamyl-tRNA(Gln) amidotransferase subunit B/E catalytic domain-containing protein n=1 Tax=Melampsora larici-populina (strain 98AG31 / pathotype 3-4-7) TaxID=747676 RepID=F4SDB1_MELLP|nr:uncharacterized protein MELLADRAFT_85611 [Melampsora larici-populina 98AG31]EGF97368.1 hypothetical protein MELLADRAFT_85611 [Melampsora larici-populina 98AG31]
MLLAILNLTIAIGPQDGSDREFDVLIKQFQLEQDTAKSYKDPLGDDILIDINRSGAAMAEILQALRAIGVSKGNMEQVSLRCDVNVSVKPK